MYPLALSRVAKPEILHPDKLTAASLFNRRRPSNKTNNYKTTTAEKQTLPF